MYIWNNAQWFKKQIKYLREINTFQTTQNKWGFSENLKKNLKIVYLQL